MPITLQKIADNTASVTINVDEDTCTIVYYPSRITEKTIKQMQNFQNMVQANDVAAIEAGFESFNGVLTSLIKSWDAYEDAEETIMIPITPARFADLPIPFRNEVLSAILSDMSPNQEASTPS